MNLADLVRARATEGSVAIGEGRTPMPPVGPSPDLDRILSLPSWEPDPQDLEDLKASVTIGSMQLRDLQAKALLAALLSDGLFAAMGVGRGKTLVAALLPTVLDRRAVVLLPPGLIGQAKRMIQEYRRNFLLRDDFELVAYSTLSSASQADVLERLAPELIVADEAHSLKDPASSRTKRFLRYMRSHPTTAFCGLSGTMTRRSILDFAHLLKLALGNGSPLPLHYPTLKEWAEALDVPKAGPPRPAGALRALGEGPIQEAWGRKFAATRGVVTSPSDELGCTLVIRETTMPTFEVLTKHVDRLHTRWERPDGEQLTTAMQVAQVERQLRLGGWYSYEFGEEVPFESQLRWKRARKEWHQTLRDLLKAHGHKPGLDSPLLMSNAVADGRFPDAQKIRSAWVLAHLEIPQPRQVWNQADPGPLNWIVERVKAGGHQIVWTDTVEVGKSIARLGGWRYYGSGDDPGLELGDRTIVCSMQAHGTGRNLQMFARATVAGGGPTGAVWEQLLGRLHREGQQADEVVFEVLFPEELVAARRDAEYIQSTTGNPQKLLIANTEEI